MSETYREDDSSVTIGELELERKRARTCCACHSVLCCTAGYVSYVRCCIFFWL